MEDDASSATEELGQFPAPRRDWEPPEGYVERLRAHYEEEFATAGDAPVLVFSHARRSDRPLSRTAIIFGWLRDAYGVREIPLYVAEDVPHDRTGYPVESRHTMNEKEAVIQQLQPYKDIVQSHADAGTLLTAGSEPAVRPGPRRAKATEASRGAGHAALGWHGLVALGPRQIQSAGWKKGAWIALRGVLLKSRRAVHHLRVPRCQGLAQQAWVPHLVATFQEICSHR